MFKKFYIQNKSSKKYNHWKYCKSNNIPYIAVKQKIKYSSVDLDMYAVDYELSEIGQKLIEKQYEIEHDYMESLWRGHKPSSEQWLTSIGKLGGLHQKIPNERIPTFCEKIFDIAMKYNQPLTIKR